MSDLRIMAIDLEKHHAMIASWWEKHQFVVLPKTHLPPNGLISLAGDTPLAAAFLYRTDSAMGWLEFMVTNPDANPITRARGLRLVIDKLSELAPKIGIQSLFTSTVNSGLEKMLLKSGFTMGDKNSTQLVRTVWQ